MNQEPLFQVSRKTRRPWTNNVNLLGSKAAQQMDLITVKHCNLGSTTHKECIFEVHTYDCLEITKEQLLNQFSDVFDGLGDLGEHLHLEVDNVIKPVQLPPRRVPEALGNPLKNHLQELEQWGVIEKVMQLTDWVSGIVVAQKSNGKIWLCLDPHPLNTALKRSLYPIRTIEDVLPDLANAKIFTKVDCQSGCWQVKLNPDLSLLTAFNMPFGISPTPPRPSNWRTRGHVHSCLWSAWYWQWNHHGRGHCWPWP